MKTNLIQKAYEYALRAHKNQFYGDKEFIVHPILVARILVEIDADNNLICAGYLHDVLENTKVTYEDLKKEFNKDIANLVLEVTKTGYNTFPHLKTPRGVCF